MACGALSFVLGWKSAGVHVLKIQAVEKRTLHSEDGSGPINLASHTEDNTPLVKGSAVRVLREEQTSRQWVILASTNLAFLDFTNNWLESLKRCGITDHVTIIAEDKDVYEKLRNRTDITLDVRLTSAARLSSELLQFGSEDYLKLVNKRPEYIRDFLRQGIDVIFSDVDTVWLQNPLSYFTGDYDIHFEKDLYEDATRPDMICAGFAYYSATNATINFIQNWIDFIEKRPNIPDQQVLNRLMKKPNIRKSLNLNFLDPRRFPNGNDFFNEEWREKHADIKPVVVHNNWIKGHDVKIERFRNVSMWYL
ncbi:uncharacterized protein [Diadema setosum]|uniref:uncharacterized protein n=1 Tax=Diadema setosum TaxID=31175 RepID=UPI003B3A0D58